MFLNITFYIFCWSSTPLSFSFLFLTISSKDNSEATAFGPAGCRTMISYVSALMLFNAILLNLER